ncbi:MAG: class I SAM-dependent methyltransferase [Anaerolineae bacterium]|nr:class I SAM-dependent methyltransferase [Anaerolineae bacterium]
MPNEYHEQNRLSWDAATRQHHTHRPDMVARYRAGHNNLHPEDMALLGDVRGKRLVHLQCNDGQDTISIARHLGADVTGVDISDYAVTFARQLAAETDTPATFVRGDIFDWCAAQQGEFDIVYTSYGALTWISDIARWGRGVAQALAPGGKLVLIEFHPVMGMYEIDWTVDWPYMGGGPIETGGVGDYFDESYQNAQKAYEFAWGISEVVSALLDAGLTLTGLKEYEYLNGWQRFPDMIPGEGRRWLVPPGRPRVPCMFSIVAVKPSV